MQAQLTFDQLSDNRPTPIKSLGEARIEAIKAFINTNTASVPRKLPVKKILRQNKRNKIDSSKNASEQNKSCVECFKPMTASDFAALKTLSQSFSGATFTGFHQDARELQLSDLSQNPTQKINHSKTLPLVIIGVDQVRKKRINLSQKTLMYYLQQLSGKDVLLNFRSMDLVDDLFISKLCKIKNTSKINLTICFSLNASHLVKSYSQFRKFQLALSRLIRRLNHYTINVSGEINNVLPYLNDGYLPLYVSFFKSTGIRSVHFHFASIPRCRWYLFLNWLSNNGIYKESLIRNLFRDSFGQKEKSLLDIDDQYKTIVDCRFNASCKKLGVLLPETVSQESTKIQLALL